MSDYLDRLLPSLDCHAHVSPSVTPSQVEQLGRAFVFGMTRSLSEAQAVVSLRQDKIIWGCGVHPGVRSALLHYSEELFTELLPHFLLVGEVGLDRRAADWQTQVSVLRSIFSVVARRPVLVSLHSAGSAKQIVDELENTELKGPILHWFTGNEILVSRATDLGCYFSVNAAMTDEQLARFPTERILPETDFPIQTRNTAAKRPGDSSAVEDRLAELWKIAGADVRLTFFRNLRSLLTGSGVLPLAPEALLDELVAV